MGLLTVLARGSLPASTTRGMLADKADQEAAPCAFGPLLSPACWRLCPSCRPSQAARLYHLPLAVVRHPHDAHGTRLVSADIRLRGGQGLERQHRRDRILVEHPHRLPHRAFDPQAARAIGLVEEFAQLDLVVLGLIRAASSASPGLPRNPYRRCS
jgi:hypothetical protein